MESIPAGLRYSENHEWVLIEGSTATVGITAYAQDHLGDVVYLELPRVGARVKQFETFGVVESVKAASDVYAPVSGVVTAVNNDLTERPSLVNESPYTTGWIIKIDVDDLSELQNLQTASEYESTLASLE